MASTGETSGNPDTAQRNVQAPITPMMPPPRPVISTTQRSRYSHVATYLQDNCKTGSDRVRHSGYRRMVPLNLQDIFNCLVELYTVLFASHWRIFKSAMEILMHGNPASSLPNLVAKNYIAHWLLDLYVSNRDAVREISHLAYAQYYSTEIYHTLIGYDDFLVTINAAIRPTQIANTAEDTMYIPHFGINAFADVNNPFNITGWFYDYDVFHATTCILEEKREWILSKLQTNVTGRAFWLLDWYDGNRAYAWFPQEGNYSDEDIAVAYIIGTACTTKLAPRDNDEWQYYPQGIKPAVITSTTHRRLTNRTMFGSIEERVVHEREIVPELFSTDKDQEDRPSKKRRAEDLSRALIIRESGKEGREGEQHAVGDAPEYSEMDTEGSTSSTPQKKWQYKIQDFVYFRKVILRADLHTRLAALKMIAIEGRKATPM